MTNDERREARYQRRQEKRRQNQAKRNDKVGTLSDAFSYSAMFRYGHKCCNGVRWKMSTQNFERHLFSGTATLRTAVLKGTWQPRPCVSFVLRERGKTRQIDAPHVVDRHLHKTLVNRVMIPLYRPHMIADNGASRAGGGLHWHYARIKKQLGRHFRKHGRKGAVLQLDLKGFFPNANRELIYARHAELIHDPDLRQLADKTVRLSPSKQEGHGMALGLELSQIEMTALPTAIDQWLKCQQHIAACGHYMDDYYVICEDRGRLQCIADEMMERFEAAGIPVNKDKCRITPLTKSFRFCKAKFTLTETGRVVVHRCRDGIKRARRKLRMFRRALDAGMCTITDVEKFMECERAYYKRYDDHGRILHLERLYHALFIDRR